MRTRDQQQKLFERFSQILGEYAAYSDIYQVTFNETPYETVSKYLKTEADENSSAEYRFYLETMRSLLSYFPDPTNEQKKRIFEQCYQKDGWRDALDFVFDPRITTQRTEEKIAEYQERLSRGTGSMKPGTSVYHYSLGYLECLQYCLSVLKEN
jgi:hypothetical protein